MARMLREGGDSLFRSCCSHCDRKKKGFRKTARRERHLLRQRERRQWRQETSDQ